MNTVGKSLEQLLNKNPFVSYTYSYPHKTAYRAFEPPIPLVDLWANENRQSLFLYFHVPFCEMRCGFCNLFTMVNHDTSLEQRYLDAIKRQAERTQAALGAANFTRMALGGGTPTYLDVDGLASLFDLAENTFGCSPDHMPVSVETSPLTATPEKLSLLRERGVNRMSIGVQSFVESEVNAIGRSQKNAVVDAALRNIRDGHFPILNIDLIYGLPGQTVESWLETVRIALLYAPEELYLYPLYVRPLTGLDRLGLASDASAEDSRMAYYRAARDVLLSAGSIQVTMRMFRAAHAPAQDGPVYCVQEDGMVGLGCGARSYTRTHHYSSEYAVSKRGVQAILADYINRPIDSFDVVQYGIELTPEEQRRRYVIKSLLEANGLMMSAYERRFGSDVWQDFPQLGDLIDLGLASSEDQTLRLTSVGLEWSDTIGPWLYSPQMQARMEAYELR
jgi:oxygen-independent coproporphyrinogen III oxidase